MSLHPRPEFHFTPKQNWMNDPNGLVYYKGKYHLFFQHNPIENVWGHMSWGHAVSEDLVNWQELPVAISEEKEHAIFSGSAVVDHLNTTGFGTIENPAMVAIYTAHKHDHSHQAQCLAFSLDEGLTWSKYQENPVLDLSRDHFRDPKVSWNEEMNAWLMAVVLPTEKKVSFYKSINLKEWQHLSDFGPAAIVDGDWECPDLFPLTVAGDKSKIRWVLIVSLNPGGLTGGSGTQYFIGNWNGKEFIAYDLNPRWIDYGRDNYAGITFNNAPNGRRIFIGWMNNWEYAREFPTSPWRGSMTIPRELTLNKSMQLCASPVKEFEDLVSPEPVGAIGVNALDIKIIISTLDSNSTQLRISAQESKFVLFGYEAETRSVYVDRGGAWNGIESSNLHSAPVKITEDSFELRAIIDSSSIELFVADGSIVITDLLYLPGDKGKITFKTASGYHPPRAISAHTIRASR